MDAEREIDALYDLPLAEFTAARNEVAKRLAREGERDAAERVRALRKPSVPAWAVNQLARRARADVEALLAAGARLRDAQRSGFDAGARAAFAAAAEEQRAAIGRLLDAARSLESGERGALSGSALDRVGETLRAASVDEDAAELVRAGRLTEELDATGFGPLPEPGAAPRRRSAPRGAGREDRSAKQRQLRQALAAARDQVRDRRRAVADAERELDRLERAVADARRELEDERTRLASAVERLEAFERDARRAP